FKAEHEKIKEYYQAQNTEHVRVTVIKIFHHRHKFSRTHAQKIKKEKNKKKLDFNFDTGKKLA
ncbi:MAG: hypothetical protein JXL67_02545, partial [Calditrichaeota bacterium]|nr:hypothetical protein [Calditrichota bacterium]